MSENTHALLSPSGSYKWLACAGSLAMEDGMPDDGNKYSDEGNCAHAVAAMCLTESKPAAAYVGRRIEVGNCRTFEFNSDMVVPVQEYLNYIRHRMESYRLAGATSVELHVEQSVPIGHITGEPGACGTADAVIVAQWKTGMVLIDVTDLKFGQGVEVRAEENPQLMLYTLGAIELLGMIYDFTEPQIQINVFQPRKQSLPSEWECSYTRLLEFAQQASKAGAAAMYVYNSQPSNIEEHLTPGDHCRKSFCKARASCPKLASFVQEQVGADFEIIEKAEFNASAAGHIAATAPVVLTDDQLGLKQDAVDLIEDWCRAVRAETERRLLAGIAVPSPRGGYKLVQGRQGARAWSDSAEAEKLLKSFRLKNEEMYEFKLISPTTAEKLLKESPKRWTKAQALITRSDGKLSVAPVSDKRPAVEIKPVIDDFDVVETAEAEGLV